MEPLQCFDNKIVIWSICTLATSLNLANRALRRQARFNAQENRKKYLTLI